MSSPMRTIARGIKRQNGYFGYKRFRKNEFKAQQRIDRELAAKRAQKAAKLANVSGKLKSIVARIRSTLAANKGKAANA